MADHRPTQNPRHADASAVGTSFTSLGVPAAFAQYLAKTGIDSPFPIQTATLPDSIAGRDVLGRGRTGSGKTLAFVLPMLVRLADGKRSDAMRPRALILAPTRELARQILLTIEPLAKLVNLHAVAVFGGVAAGPQLSAFRRGVDIVVACPGRLDDLIKTGGVKMNAVEITVLDEADHMADLGFLPVVKRLLDQTPKGGQRLLFSATLDSGVGTLVSRYLNEPVVHSVDDEACAPVEMDHHVLHIDAAERLPVLVDLTAAPGRTVVFTRTKHRAKQLTRQLVSAGVPAVEMHGNLNQGARTRNLAAFSAGRATVMVATDIAARGIHIDDVRLVIHADPPVEHKAYLHRSGRTARAGASGTVVTLATEDQRSDVRQLGRKAGINPTITRHHPGHPVLRELAPGDRTLLSPSEAASAVAASTGAQTTGSGSGNAGSNTSGERSARPPRSRNRSKSGSRSGGSRTGGGARSGGDRPASPAAGRGSRARQGAN